MTTYIAKRVGYAVFVVWAAYTITFVLLYLLPSDPIEIMLIGSGEGVAGADPEAVRYLEEKYGFDKPPIIQYFTMLGSVAVGDFGNSISSGRPVIDHILESLPHTLQLGALAIVLGTVLGIGLAVVANLVPWRGLRTLLFAIPSASASIPTFFVGLVLIQIFAFGLHLLPSNGNASPAHLILPALTLAVPTSAGIAQVTAKALDDNLHSDYADYLRAKGLGETRILFSHALRNAIIPAVTLIGVSVGGILAGAVVSETVFSRQGLGRLMQNGVVDQDIPVVQGVVIFCALVYAVANLVVDLGYTRIDPRVKLT